MLKSQVSKSAVMREFIAKYPNAGAKELCQRIKEERKINVSETVFYNLKRRPKPQQADGHIPPNVTHTLEALRVFKRAVSTMGGYEKAREALDILYN